MHLGVERMLHFVTCFLVFYSVTCLFLFKRRGYKPVNKLEALLQYGTKHKEKEQDREILAIVHFVITCLLL